jgi:hypothetical protein
MDKSIRVLLVEAIFAIFFAACSFIFYVLSSSYLFNFTYFERKTFGFISTTSFVLMIPIPLFLAMFILSRRPEFKTDYARFKKQIKSLKKIQKIGLVLVISGLLLLAISFIVPIYLDFFYGFVPFKLIYEIFFILGPNFFAFGLVFFILFFGFKKLKQAKTWSDLFKNEEFQKEKLQVKNANNHKS